MKADCFLHGPFDGPGRCPHCEAEAETLTLRNVPTYLGANKPLWDAWRQIQAKGGGEAHGPSWRISSVDTGDGVHVMRLEVTFR